MGQESSDVNLGAILPGHRHAPVFFARLASPLTPLDLKESISGDVVLLEEPADDIQRIGGHCDRLFGIDFCKEFLRGAFF